MNRQWVLAGLLSLVTMQSLYSQSARVRGTVRDGAGKALEGVEVRVQGGQLRTTTDVDGKFAIWGLPPGRATLQAIRIGYKPATRQVELDTLIEAVADLSLQADEVRLPEIEVKGRMTKPAKYLGTAKFDEVFHRRRLGLGTLITREQIEKFNAFNTVDVLRNIPGIVVAPRGGDPVLSQVRFARCSPGPNANIEVYIDGMRQIQRDSVPVPGFESGPGGKGGLWGSRISVSLARIAAPGIEMIEVYRGVSEIPAEYNNNACAVILIWTRWNPAPEQP